jgi:hypothetical protein
MLLATTLGGSPLTIQPGDEPQDGICLVMEIKSVKVGLDFKYNAHGTTANGIKSPPPDFLQKGPTVDHDGN